MQYTPTTSMIIVTTRALTNLKNSYMRALIPAAFDSNTNRELVTYANSIAATMDIRFAILRFSGVVTLKIK
jgi:hypothetical protein